jgi:hypothetical protein
MSCFQVISGDDEGINFPDWTSPSLMNYAVKIWGEISFVHNDLSWSQVDTLAAFGKKELDLAARDSANFHANYLESGESLDPEDKIYYEERSTPEGARLREGEGIILYSRLIEDDDAIVPPDWKSVETILPEQDAVCVLYAYALYLVDNALSSRIADDIEGALGHLAMAGDVMITASEEISRERGINWQRTHATAPMRAGAHKRHAETRALRAEVVKHWSKNIDRNLSGEKAATILSKVFPLSHRKLSEYVMAEKKKLRASKT